MNCFNYKRSNKTFIDSIKGQGVFVSVSKCVFHDEKKPILDICLQKAIN